MAFFLFIFVSAFLITVICISSLPGALEVSASKAAKVGSDELFDKVLDLRTWADWLPWLILEPDCPLESSENPSAIERNYCWDGKLVGAGTLTHKQIDRPTYIEETLSLTRPLKSESKVIFDFREVKEGTLICWTMLVAYPAYLDP